MPELPEPITTTEQLQEHVDSAVAAAVRDHKERTRSKFADYDDLVQFKKDAEETLAQATAQLDSVRSERDAALEAVSSKDLEILRRDVAETKRVPVRWVLGESREDMETAADEWLADVQARTKPGVVPGQGTGKEDLEVSNFDTGRERAEARFGRK